MGGGWEHFVGDSLEGPFVFFCLGAEGLDFGSEDLGVGFFVLVGGAFLGGERFRPEARGVGEGGGGVLAVWGCLRWLRFDDG